MSITSRTPLSRISRDIDVSQLGTLATIEGAPSWNADKIKELIRQVQSGSISYAEFSKGIIDGGVTNCWAYLAGKRVIYMGQYGDFHVEWFPGQKQD